MDKLLKTFETYGEYLEYVSRPVTGCIQSRDGSEDFTKTPSYESALELARSGWIDGANKSKTIAEPLFTRISSLIERPSVIYDVQGTQIDIGRYLDNEPECWQEWEHPIVKQEGTRIVRLVFNGFVSCGIPNSTIESVGATLTALVELLEYSGCRVEIVYDLFFSRSNTEAHVKIKAADQPLDVPRLAFVFGHPSAFRRIGFSFLEQMPNERRELDTHYGYPYQHELIGDITIPCLSYFNIDLQDTYKAQAWIIERLQECGVNLKQTEGIC